MIPASSWACAAASARNAVRPGRRRRRRARAAGRRRPAAGSTSAEHRVHPADRVADAHAAEGVAVVAAAHGQHPGPLGAAEAALVLQHHLERDLDAHRAGVGEEDVLEPVRRERRPAARPAGSPGAWVSPPNITCAMSPSWRRSGGVELRVRRSRGSPPTTTTSRRRARCRPPAAAGRRTRRLDQPHRRRLGHRRVGVPDVLAVVARAARRAEPVRHWGRRRCRRRGGAWPGRASGASAGGVRRRRRAPRSRCRGSARGRPRRPGPPR